MELEFRTAPPLAEPSELLAVPVFQTQDALSESTARIDEALGGVLSRARAQGDFRGREEDSLFLYGPGEEGPARIVFLGAGSPEELDGELVRRLAGRAVRVAEAHRLTQVSFLVPGPEEGEGEVRDAGEVAYRIQATAEGLALASWDFRELRSDPEDAEDGPPPIVTRGWLHLDPAAGEMGLEEGGRAVATGQALASGQNLARDLQWRPGNVATPTHLGSVAQELADSFGFEARILGPGELEEERMEALLAVSRGSDEEPRLIVLKHQGGGDDAPTVALVGKGLTFDTGGVSLKPAKGMESMKYDMSGGAAVLGAMKTVGLLNLPLNVVGVVPASENMVNGSANKPGDVIGTRAGKTVEVINTDAEGRLILADALSYTVDHFAPSAVVDCATLTGACVVALGHHAAALLGTDDDLMEEIRAAGDRSGERCWPLPLWKPYRKQLESTVADLKNVGGRPAGTITAGWFLSEFVGTTSWAHLDIAGTAYGESDLPFHRKGGFGFPTRLLAEWLLARAG